MEMIIKEGKNEIEILNSILEDQKLNNEDIVYIKNEKKAGLFKGNIVEVIVYKKEDIYKEVKEYLNAQ